MELSQNTLSQSQSVYLRQHADNPIWWHAWSPEVLSHARERKKPLFVSIGYATCHWCHVMAADTFSNAEVAETLNQHFVCIKVDREERPDIDAYLMQFLVATTGRGGWPLNAFLTPDGRPFFATTYVGSEPRFGMPGFTQFLDKVLDFYEKNADEISVFEPSGAPQSGTAASEELTGEPPAEHVAAAVGAADPVHGGFGTSQKFPPHAPLLYLQYLAAATAEQEIEPIIALTLDRIATGGLHDHLQGGFFRYCVDREWRIPHFEKMLYDQALLLWSFSLALRRRNDTGGDRNYARVVRQIVRCLEETFAEPGADPPEHALFVSGHDADTDHEEGATYLWRLEEVESVLEPAEREAFTAAYAIDRAGKFEGKTHLRRIASDAELSEREGAGAVDRLRSAEQKLLALRRGRRQPVIDTKVHTAWNALAGCALFEAGRSLSDPMLLERGVGVLHALLERHYTDGRLAHSSLADDTEFLSDYASLLLLATYAHEEYSNQDAPMREIELHLRRFTRDGRWLESENSDFRPVYADPFDQPVPSGASIARLALLRLAVLRDELFEEMPYGRALEHDFANISALASAGYFYQVGAPGQPQWSALPINTIAHRSSTPQTCYKGVCTPGMPVSR